MMIITHQPILGVPPGTLTEVDDEEGAWLVANGYASTAGTPTVQAAPVAPSPAPASAVAPRRAASKADWVAWAVAHGATEAEAEAMTKAELVEAYR